MKKKNLLLMLLAVMALLLIPVSVQAAAAKPGTVKLSSIKAVDYNKINIKWKKPSGKFTNYCIKIYRATGLVPAALSIFWKIENNFWKGLDKRAFM